MLDLLERTLAPDFALMPLDLPGCPVFVAMACPLSDGVTGCKPRLPAGRGVTLHQALIAAGAEAVELRASLAQSHLADLARCPRDHGLAQVTARDLRTGAEVRLPAQSVYLDAAEALSEPLLSDATSTGCAAGQTAAVAARAGLWECVERDALALWWHGGRAPGALALDVLDARHPRLSWWLDGRDRAVRLFDLTSDIGLPVVAALSADATGRRIALGSAAGLTLAEAALAAVTEMVQTEIGMEQARQARDPEVAAWDTHADWTALPQFRPDPDRPASAAPMTGQALLDRLHRLGHQVLVHETTLPGDPLPSVRVLVPGLCAMGGRIDTDRFRRLCPDRGGPCLPEPF